MVKNDHTQNIWCPVKSHQANGCNCWYESGFVTSSVELCRLHHTDGFYTWHPFNLHIYLSTSTCLLRQTSNGKKNNNKKSQAAYKSICTEYRKWILNAVQWRSTLDFKMEAFPFREAGNSVHSWKRKTEHFYMFKHSRYQQDTTLQNKTSRYTDAYSILPSVSIILHC